MDAEADRHAALGHAEQGRLRAGERAAGEGDAEGAGALVRELREPGDLGEVAARLRGGGGDAEDGEVAGDAAALVLLVGSGREDVVGDGHGLAGDPFGAEAVLRGVEVEHVAGVVAVAEEHAAAVVGGLGDRDDLLRRGRGEEVPHRRAVRESGSDESAEGGVVARPAADDDGDLAVGHDGAADDPSGDAADRAAVGRDEAVDHLVGEGGRVIP